MGFLIYVAHPKMCKLLQSGAARLSLGQATSLQADERYAGSPWGYSRGHALSGTTIGGRLTLTSFTRRRAPSRSHRPRVAVSCSSRQCV